MSRRPGFGQYQVWPAYTTSLGCGCGAGLGTDPPPSMANPASVYCSQHGGKSQIVKDPKTGNESAFCVFPDGSQCEEWAFSRGECKPAGKTASSTTPLIIAAIVGLGLGVLLGSRK